MPGSLLCADLDGIYCIMGNWDYLLQASDWSRFYKFFCQNLIKMFMDIYFSVMFDNQSALSLVICKISEFAARMDLVFGLPSCF